MTAAAAHNPATRPLPRHAHATAHAGDSPLPLFLGLAFLYTALTLLVLHSGLLQ
jgi:hypothetical protein